MKDNEELKKYSDISQEALAKAVGGHRHSRYYEAGHYVGKAIQAGLAIAGVIGLCCATNNKNNN